ncbi:hypothetical protein EDM56_23530 [Brevibacillus fluminis]|uniref:Uncharacterized protein n=1 Tax=Brevibacillus fluminis TaxID=511487 RepID=A0A3M8D2J9_9BACL|nr:hypothetical protein [Brevibacillus fluminis]RNB82300.1 hypothetical protein EDM56_23530 [Brevibacillus fluminis]
MKLNKSIYHMLHKQEATAVMFGKLCADATSLALVKAGAIRIRASAGVSIVSREEATESGY